MNTGDPYPVNQLPSGECDQWELYSEEEHGLHNRDPIDAFYEDKYLKQIGKL